MSVWRLGRKINKRWNNNWNKWPILQENILKEADLRLEKVINQFRATEAGKLQVKRLQEKTIKV